VTTDAPTPVAEPARDHSIVVARGLHRAYRGTLRETAALRGVDLDVARGEWVAIMGPSGCGKSTLLNLIGGLDSPDGGTVQVAGEEVSSLSETRRSLLRRSHVGIVFQFFNLVSDLSVADNIELPLLLAGATRSAARDRRSELLRALEIEEMRDALPSELSGGQQQRVALARALANEPDVLLADEPTGNLDTQSARQVLALLRREHAAGQTIVMVTHDPRVAAAADRTLVMEDGRFRDAATGGREPAGPEFAPLVGNPGD
jgi:putative ABC transport system ATP-binding protein